MMKFKLSLFLIAVLSTAILVSCKGKYEQEIKEVGELQYKLNELSQTFNSLDYDRVKEAKQAYNDNLENVSKYYVVPDTIDPKFAELMNKYKGIKKSTKNFDSNFETHSTNIGNMQIHLNNLIQDLENELIPEDSVQAFIEFERTKLEMLSDKIGSFVVDCDYAIEIHDSLSEEVKNFVISSYTK